jgi:hypothetical protein
MRAGISIALDEADRHRFEVLVADRNASQKYEAT